LVFLGVFAKLQKVTFGIVMSVSPTIRPHGTAQLPCGGFFKKNSSLIKI
jgi:hypothetical protein